VAISHEFKTSGTKEMTPKVIEVKGKVTDSTFYIVPLPNRDPW